MNKLIIILLIVATVLVLGGIASRYKKNAATSNITDNIKTILSPGADDSFVHADGQKILDGFGNKLYLRGVNLEGWLQWQGLIFGGGLQSQSDFSQQLIDITGKDAFTKFQQGVYENFITESDIQKISQMGFNVVRLPVNYRAVQNDTAWKYIDELVTWAKKYNVYVIIDLHSAPGGQSKLFTADPGEVSLWDSESNRTDTIAIWKKIADRYKNERIIAGYDLLNEPDPSNDGSMVQLYQDITTAIREVDKSHMIIIEGTKFSTDFSVFTKPIDSNMAYTFHTYALLGKDTKDEIVARMKKLSNEQNVPVFNSEFGANTYDWTSDAKILFEDSNNDIQGWIFWNWKNTEASTNKDQYRNLMVINPPASVQGLMKWISWPHWPGEQPSKEDAITGLEDYPDALKLENTTQDSEMTKILTQN